MREPSPAACSRDASATGRHGSPVTTANRAGSDRAAGSRQPSPLGRLAGCQHRARYGAIRFCHGSPEPWRALHGDATATPHGVADLLTRKENPPASRRQTQASRHLRAAASLPLARPEGTARGRHNRQPRTGKQRRQSRKWKSGQASPLQPHGDRQAHETETTTGISGPLPCPGKGFQRCTQLGGRS